MELTKMHIVIPALEPDERLEQLCVQLKKNIEHIWIVDDGSSTTSQALFQRCADLDCHVLHHQENKGKGRALKTAFQAIKDSELPCDGVACADSDGQHSVEDILYCLQKLIEHPKDMILGTRCFKQEHVPAKSRIGNQVTSAVMKSLCEIDLKDTQTGLRAFSYDLMKELIDIDGERYEYELNVLLEMKARGIKMYEADIETRYIDENKGSHFHPFLDSLRIYRLFFKFIIASLSSSLIDILLFTIFVVLCKDKLTWYILAATILARVCSSIFNFIVNKHAVFESEETSYITAIKYFSLCIVQMMSSALLVQLLYWMSGIFESGLKIGVDIFLFFISFHIQREWIFHHKTTSPKKRGVSK